MGLEILTSAFKASGKAKGSGKGKGVGSLWERQRGRESLILATIDVKGSRPLFFNQRLPTPFFQRNPPRSILQQQPVACSGEAPFVYSCRSGVSRGARGPVAAVASCQFLVASRTGLVQKSCRPLASNFFLRAVNSHWRPPILVTSRG